MVGWFKVIIMSNITEVKFGYVTLSYIITSGEGRGGVFKILHDYGGEGGVSNALKMDYVISL